MKTGQKMTSLLHFAFLSANFSQLIKTKTDFRSTLAGHYLAKREPLNQLKAGGKYMRLWNSNVKRAIFFGEAETESKTDKIEAES